VLIGPRVGIQIDRSSDLQIRHNYSHHIYYGGWSQGNNFELGGTPTLTAERNVIVGSSWTVRGVAGEFRYNLVLEAGHDWLWADFDGANVHHNVFVGGDNDRGGIFVLYGPKNVRIQNNTIDALNGTNVNSVMTFNDGDVRLTSNLFLNVPKPAVTVGSANLTADYNLFWNSASPFYSDHRTPLHDRQQDPRLSDPPSASVIFDEAAVWTRALSVSDILKQYRVKYTPTEGSPALSGGDPSDAGNYVGAIGHGASDSSDQFGR
jgi:hypothetical protein